MVSKLGGLPDLSYGPVTTQQAPVPESRGAGDLWGELADAAEGVRKLAQPALSDLAAKAGANAVQRDAKGNLTFTGDRTVITDTDAAYMNAALLKYMSQASMDVRSGIAKLQEQNLGNPDGFKAAVPAFISGQTANAPEAFQQPLTDMIMKQADATHAAMIQNKLQSDVISSKSVVDANYAGVTNALTGFARMNKLDDPRAVDLLNQATNIIRAKVGNPLFNYSQEQADQDIAELKSTLKGESIVGHVDDLYRAYGEAEAETRLKNLMDDPALNLTPSERQSFYSQGLQEIRQLHALTLQAAGELQRDVEYRLDDAKAAALATGDYHGVVSDDEINRAFATNPARAHQIIDQLHAATETHSMTVAVQNATPAQLAAMDQKYRPSATAATPAPTEEMSPAAAFQRNQPFVKPGDHNYNTPLSSADEAKFEQWVKDNHVPFDVGAKVSDYDMRGFWKAMQEGNPLAKNAIDPNDNKIHYPDYWKTPYHRTFSNESQWANPATAPHWTGDDKLVTPDGKVLFDDRAQSGGATAAAVAPPSEQIVPKLKQAFPNARITEFGTRPQNAAYGVGPSDHKQDHAIDTAPIKGVTFGQFKSWAEGLGLPGLQVIDETSPAAMRAAHATGPNWHIGWSANRGAPGQPGSLDFADQMRVYSSFREAVTARNQAITSDPAAYAFSGHPDILAMVQSRDVGVAQEGDRRLLATQRDLGVPNPELLSKPAVQSIVASFNNAPDPSKKAETMIATIAALQQRYGANYPMVMRQLVRGGLPNDALALDWVKDDPLVASRMANAVNTGRKALEDQVPDMADVKKQVLAGLAEFNGTLRGFGGSADASQRIQAAQLYAMQLAAEGVDPSTAGTQAVRDVILKHYNFQDGYRIPQGVDSGHVGAGAAVALGTLSAANLEPYADATAGATVEDRRNLSEKLLKSGAGQWVTLPDDSGLALTWGPQSGFLQVRDGKGKPIRFTWAQLSTMGTRVPTAAMDVTRPVFASAPITADQ